MSRVVIDPVTRVNGGLRVEVEVADGAVSDAWVSGTMFRGLETVLRGREPLGAWLLAQRICGDCSGVHALASVRAVENALGVAIPRNARTIRNLLLGSEFVLDHVAHFYQGQVLDWLRPLTALAADPADTSALARTMSPRLLSDAAYFRDARDRLSTFVASGGSGPFLDDGSAGPAPLTSPEATLMVMAHYLEALDWRRQIVQLQTLLGGKSPHPQTFLVGGMAVAAPWGGPPPAPPGEHPAQIDQRAPSALSADGIALIAKIVAAAKAFVDEVYVPDVLEIARADPGVAQVGAGLGDYLAFGEFPLEDSAKPGLLLPRGRVIGRDLASVQPVDEAEIGETVAASHYTYDGDDGASRHPSQGLTVARYGGPALPFTSLAGAERYSWIKAPRYRGEALEVGPLARVLVAYVEGQQAVRDRVQQVVGGLGLGPDILFSTLGRTLARAIEAGVVVDRLGVWVNELQATLGGGDLAVADLSHWSPQTWPSTADGVSLGEGPRGAVGHWLTIADGRLAAYQVIDGSTWNASPRDAAGRRGAIEEALVGVPVPDPARPTEVLRTVRSFGPCLTCAVH
ncbi:MAG: nickel-dependent hydrogenase large subunit [Candidatus Limnocylindrales bacterium]